MSVLSQPRSHLGIADNVTTSFGRPSSVSSPKTKTVVGSQASVPRMLRWMAPLESDVRAGEGPLDLEEMPVGANLVEVVGDLLVQHQLTAGVRSAA